MRETLIYTADVQENEARWVIKIFYQCLLAPIFVVDI